MARVFVIDDSAFSRGAIGQVLKQGGHEVTAFDRAQKALTQLEADVPDVIVTDLMMPEMDGLGFLVAIQKTDVCVPVIVLTADIQDSTRDKCMELGAEALVNKPVRPKPLLGAVAEALAKRGAA